MDKNFTFRFYDVSRKTNSSPAMVDILRFIAAKPMADREKLLATDYTVRLEKLEDDGPHAVVGELTRCQNTNLPSEIDSDDRKALEVDRLGHSVVFRLNWQTGVLGVQFDTRVVSPGKILEYLSAFNTAAIYSIAPKIDAQNWAKFNSGSTRKLTFKVANPDDMGDLDGSAKAASDSFKAMADAYDAPAIQIEISMGHKSGFLSTAVTGLAQQLASMAFPGAQLEKLTAKTVVNDEMQVIDLIEELVVAKDALEIHDRDPEVNWNVKRLYICSKMQSMFA
ncbi:MAG: hypothetical protein ABIK36_12255 [Pseudomonadota bacterium]